ncbi:MAG: hypothetical protein AMXMBFR12_07100 [Candidatus Babeliales bacterium]
MRFIIGYFGTDVSLSQKIKTIADQNSNAASLVCQQDNHFTVHIGVYKQPAQEIDSVIPFEQSNSILVGKLFTRDTYQKQETFNAIQTKDILENPALLNKQYWGRYSGILYHKEQQKITLMRDPLGLNTLFYMQLSDGILFASDVALIYDCLETKPEMNWSYFADYVIGSQFAPIHTPFMGILELPGGMGLHFTLDGKTETELLWDLQSIPSKPIIHEAEFENQLLDTLKKCTQAWVQDSKNVCVELSGGTDSSAVMILLSQVLRPDQKLIAVNYIDSKEPSSNEIEFAKEIADICNASIYFPDWQGASPLDPAETHCRPNRPSTFSLFKQMNQKLQTVLDAEQCNTVLNGQGGDHVFLAPPPENSLADYWIQKGIRGSLPILQELSGIYRMPYGSLLWKNIKAGTRYYAGKKVAFVGHNESHAKAVKEKQTKQLHYLHPFTKKFLHAKREQIQGLSHAVLFAERQQKTPYVTYCHPLLSLPVVELGLQIPTYQSFKDGYDRIFFRNAVSKIKKPKAMWRRIKGQTTSTMINSLAANASGIEELLMNGSLIKSGLIDSQWLSDTLTQIRHGKVDNAWPIVNFITAQQWLNQWGL